MSLDVTLTVPGPDVTVQAERIFVRRDGATVEVTRGEWDEMCPGREPVAAVVEMDVREVFAANVTHNLADMARAADLYDALWCPDESGLATAGQLVAPLRAGLEALLGDRDHFEAFNPKNGWGDYDLLVRFTENYLAACERWPDAEVSVRG